MTILITMMAIAMVGIIALQFVWMKNAFQVRNELFDRSVNEALIRTTNRIETLSDVFMVHDMVALPPPPISFNPKIRRHDPRTNKPGYFIFNRDSFQFEYGINKNNGKIEKKFRILSGQNQDTIIQNPDISSIKVDSLLSNWEDKIEHNMTVVFGNINHGFENDSTIINIRHDLNYKIDRKVEQLKNVAGKMVYETWIDNNRFMPDTNMVRTVLSEELSNRDIPISYQYAVVNPDGIKVKSSGADTRKLNNSEYSARMYPNAIFDDDEFLKVYFPGQSAFIFKTLIMPVSLSVLFCTIIMVTFGLSIYYIIHQKKISEMKSDFINNMTHEFKTPLATISVAADTILNPKIIAEPEQISHFTGIIKKENQRMNQQVETILQIARLDKKEFEFKFQIVDIHELIDKAVQGMILQVENRNGTITVEKLAANPMVTTDPAHTLNMLNNLLDNANKYSEKPPEIEVKTYNSERGVRVSVSDNGIGMSKQVQHKIFERFYREATGNVHNVKGFGLGLSYVKAVIDANKGEITVTSEPGKGTTFEVFLPYVLAVS